MSTSLTYISKEDMKIIRDIIAKSYDISFSHNPETHTYCLFSTDENDINEFKINIFGKTK